MLEMETYTLLLKLNVYCIICTLFGPGNGSPKATNFIVVLVLGVVVMRFSKH